MDTAYLLRTVRRRKGWTLRKYAGIAATSYSTLSDYEHGRKVPTVDTLKRLVEAAGMAIEVSLVDASIPTRGDRDTRPRGEQLIEVLDLADQFPSNHTETLRYPIFRLSQA